MFVETKRQADFLCLNLCEEGFPATSIHGDRLQSEREQVVPPTSTAAGAEGVQVGPAADPGGHGGGGQGPRHQGRHARGQVGPCPGPRADPPQLRHAEGGGGVRAQDRQDRQVRFAGVWLSFWAFGLVGQVRVRPLPAPVRRVGNLGRATSFFDAREDSGVGRPLVQVLVDAEQFLLLLTASSCRCWWTPSSRCRTGSAAAASPGAATTPRARTSVDLGIKKRKRICRGICEENFVQ